MKTTYEIKGVLKMSEIDNYENGCVDGGSSDYIDCRLSGDTQGEVLKKFADFVGVEIGSLDLDACEEVGRVDVYRNENANGDGANDREFELWAKGEINLYYVTYSTYVRRVTRETVSLLTKE